MEEETPELCHSCGGRSTESRTCVQWLSNDRDHTVSGAIRRGDRLEGSPAMVTIICPFIFPL